MSQSNGEKARAAIERRRRTARRVADRARKAELQSNNTTKEAAKPDNAAAKK
jgi:hypothetical protein